MAWRIRRRVWLGSLIACAGVGVWFWWARREMPEPVVVRKSEQPFVQLASAGTSQGDQVLRERAELMDPTPLFFPTDRNYGQRPLRQTSMRQPGQVFGSFDPLLPLSDHGIGRYGGEAALVPEKVAPADVLVQGNEAPLAGLGEVDRQLAILPIRSGYLEVLDLNSGETVISQAFSGVSPPRADFAPIEFLVVVGAAGLVGEPFVTNGSEWDEVDNFFRDYLVSSYRLGQRLRPGRYRVLVGG